MRVALSNAEGATHSHADARRTRDCPKHKSGSLVLTTCMELPLLRLVHSLLSTDKHDEQQIFPDRSQNATTRNTTMVRTRNSTGALAARNYAQSDNSDEGSDFETEAVQGRSKRQKFTTDTSLHGLSGFRPWETSTTLATGGKLSSEAQVSKSHA